MSYFMRFFNSGQMHVEVNEPFRYIFLMYGKNGFQKILVTPVALHSRNISGYCSYSLLSFL